MTRAKVWLTAGALVVFGLLVLAGCGGGSSSSSSGGSSTQSEGGSGGSTSEGGGSSGEAALARMEEEIEKASGPEGTFAEEPTTSPVRAGTNKSIAIISCGQEVGACKIATEGGEEAAHKLGWKTTLFDAKSNYASANTGIRNALAEGVDGIFTYLIDCQYMKAGLEEAKEAGVPVVAGEGRDCNETSSGGEELFTYAFHYQGGLNFMEEDALYGKLAAEYAIVNKEGKSNALAFEDDVPSIKPQQEATEKAYSECPECQLKVVNFPVSAYGTRLQEIGEQNILQNPEVNSVIPSYEAAALEIFPSVRSSGREEEILTFVGEGNAGGLDLIREGTNGYSVAWPVKWEGWGSVDALGRIFLGQKPVGTGLGLQIVDAEHNLPKSGPAQTPVDFEAMYEKAWGLK
jgi:ribose transport system substrate-binding protein